MFTIFDEMVESYVYLDKTQLKVSLANPDEQEKCHIFNVETEDGSYEFQSKEAHEWVYLLNTLVVSAQ